MSDRASTRNLRPLRRVECRDAPESPAHRRRLALALRAAPPRPARIIEVGQAPTEAVPTCPANPCLAVSRTTGYQAKVVDSRAVYVAPAAGKIVAFTIRLGAPNKRQIKFFEDNFGKASAGLSVLRRGERLFGRVLSASPVFPLSDYFGQTVQFPLDRALTGREGQHHRPHRPDLGARADDAGRRRQLVARQPRAQRVRQHGPPDGADDRRRPDAVPLPLQGAAHLHGDAGHQPGPEQKPKTGKGTLAQKARFPCGCSP